MFIFKSGIPVQVPRDYASTPSHLALVEALSTNSYSEAVRVLKGAPSGHWLAADILSGAPWARRFLNSTSLLWAKPDGRTTANMGLRALMHAMNGTRPKTGRAKLPPLSPIELARATEMVAAWRVIIDEVWAQGEPSETVSRVIARADRFTLARSHVKELRALARRPRLKKWDVVIVLASWEMGISLRHRVAKTSADLVYG